MLKAAPQERDTIFSVFSLVAARPLNELQQSATVHVFFSRQNSLLPRQVNRIVEGGVSVTFGSGRLVTAVIISQAGALPLETYADRLCRMLDADAQCALLPVHDCQEQKPEINRKQAAIWESRLARGRQTSGLPLELHKMHPTIS